VMRVQTDETRASVIAFAPKKGSPDATMVADDAGHGIVALVQKAADLAKADCDRAMNLAHRLSSELRAAEESSNNAPCGKVSETGAFSGSALIIGARGPY
jgi:hypothetical protein